MTTRQHAAASERREAGRMRQRAHGAGKIQRSAPGGIAQARRSDPIAGEIRAQLVDYRGRPMYQTEGYYTIHDRGYEMYDWYGPYVERVVSGAGTDTLASKPDCVFLLNHTGLAMARTAGPWNQNRGTLTLSEDDTGGSHLAYHNPERSDVQLMVSGMDDGVITEMSFAFMITDGWWSDDFETFEIRAYDIHRGDVSAVNYGANPYTSISARSNEILAQLDELPPGAIGEAIHRLSRRFDTWQAMLREVDPGTVARIADRAREARDGDPVTETERQQADEWIRSAIDPATPEANDPAPAEVREDDKVIDTTAGDGPTVDKYEALLASLGHRLPQ
jgi:HK97 family phage prohead protease